MMILSMTGEDTEVRSKKCNKKIRKENRCSRCHISGRERQDTRSGRRKRSGKDDTFEMHGRYLQTGRRQYYI